MNKAELIATIADSADVTKVVATKALDSVLANMGDALEKGERVIVSGFGSFRLVERAERQGRNPQTGTAISITAHNVVKFKPGKKLSEKVKIS